MQDLTFGEQVKIILGRKGMTIKQLAELIEEKTGKKMSRQNLTQRLGRDNFQEQDMRMIAEMLECPFHLSIMSAEHAQEPRSTAALERAATARVEAVEVSAQMEEDMSQTTDHTAQALERTSQAMDDTAQMTEEPEAKLIEETVPVSFAEESTEPEEAEEADASFVQSESEGWQNEESVQAASAAEESVQPIPAAEESVQPISAAEESAQPISAAEESVQPIPVAEESTDRDMTIGELYEIHEELNQLEKSIKEGEPVEVIKRELEKPKKERRLGSFFRRRDPESRFGKANADKENEQNEHMEAVTSADEVRSDAGEENLVQTNWSQPNEHEMNAEQTIGYEADSDQIGQDQMNGYEMNQDEAGGYDTSDQLEQNIEHETAFSKSEEADEFEPVIMHNDAEEDTEAGDVNPYTGREYQSNSVRMHPTRIGYVQVYDRTIHKWTDMTEWAFLGLQERKKALLGKAYEPPIYLD